MINESVSGRNAAGVVDRTYDAQISLKASRFG